MSKPQDDPAYLLAARQAHMMGWDSTPAVVERLVARIDDDAKIIAALSAKIAEVDAWMQSAPH